MTERTICPPHHKHEQTSTCYVAHRCGCDLCREMNRARAERRRKQIAYGRHQPRLADTERARKHILELRRLGMPAHIVAAQAGVSRGVTQRIAAGAQQVANRTTVEKILDVRPSPDLATKVPAIGAHRRLQALAFMGWTIQQVEERMGAGVTMTSWILRHDRITAELHQRVVAVYDDLWDQTPPDGYGNRRAAARARSRGWVGPLAWDDDTIDLPEHNETHDTNERKAAA